MPQKPINNKKSSSLFLNTLQFILDLLFPKHCVGCGLEGTWLCQECQNKIVLIRRPTCLICNRLTLLGQVCRRCRKKSYLSGLVVAAYYDEGPLKEAIHTFKYDYVYELAIDLGLIMVQSLQKWCKQDVVLIPVPLHRRRQAERGFNQAELLAKQLSIRYGCPVLGHKLVRTKHSTKNQAELSGKARRENIKGVFSWIGKDELIKRTVLLIDDVYTTGSTLQECAKILRTNGAKTVWAAVLAKA